MTIITSANINVIIPLDMAREAEKAIESGYDVAYLETDLNGDKLHVLAIDGDRFGLCLNGDTSWTDAHDVAEAIKRFESDDMRA